MARSRSPHRLVGRRGVEEPAQIFGRKKMRQRAPLPRIAQRLGRIRLRPAFPLPKTKEAAQRGEVSGDGRLGVARLVQRRHVAAQIEHGHVAGSGRVAAVRFGQVVGQRRQVLAVALDRVGRGVALDGQKLQEAGDGGTHRNKGSGIRGQGSGFNNALDLNADPWPLTPAPSFSNIRPCRWAAGARTATH